METPAPNPQAAHDRVYDDAPSPETSHRLGVRATKFVRGAFIALPQSYELETRDIQPIASCMTDLAGEVVVPPRYRESAITVFLRLHSFLNGMSAAKIIQEEKTNVPITALQEWYRQLSKGIVEQFDPEKSAKYLVTEMDRVRDGGIFLPRAKRPPVELNREYRNDEPLEYPGRIIPVLQRKARRP